MWIGLTGSPRIGGYERPGQARVVGRAVDESVTEVRRGGLVVVVEERYRLVGVVEWGALTEADAFELQSDIGQTCTLDLRTASAADQGWAAELTVDVLRTTDVEVTAPLRPYDASTGRPLGVIEFGFKSLATYTLEELGVIALGGYDLGAEDSESITVTPYGTATAEEAPYDVTFLGVTYNLVAVTLGDSRVVAARTEDLDDLSIRLTTRT